MIRILFLIWSPIMKLYIQQKVFSWADRFTVFDASENALYYAEGELFTWGKKLHLYNAHGVEAAYIEQRLLSFLPRYTIYRDGTEVAVVTREFTFFTQRYTVDGPGWEVDGDFLAHDYEIRDDERLVASMHKEWLSWGDCYELDITDDGDTVTALSVVLVIDCVLASQSNN